MAYIKQPFSHLNENHFVSGPYVSLYVTEAVITGFGKHLSRNRLK